MLIKYVHNIGLHDTTTINLIILICYKGWIGRDNQKIKEWATSSPFDGYKLSRLIASSHHHTAIGAITQLLQGGVAIHHYSKQFHQPLYQLTLLLCEMGCRKTQPIHQSNILLLPSSIVQSLFHQPEFTSFFPKEKIVVWPMFVFVSQSWEFNKAHFAVTDPCKKVGISVTQLN